jgi:hypothetical protein
LERHMLYIMVVAPGFGIAWKEFEKFICMCPCIREYLIFSLLLN